MKQISIVIAALLLSVMSASAQQNTKMVSLKGSARQAMNTAGKQRQMLPKSDNRMMSVAAKAPKKTIEPIEEQPAGTEYEYIMAYGGLSYNWLYGYLDATTDAAQLKVVEGVDGKVYLQGLCSNAGLDTYYWVQAEKEGDKLLIKNQPIGYYTDWSGDKHEYYIAAIDYSYDEEAGTESIVASENADFYFNYVDGKITSTDDMMLEAGDIHYRFFGSIYWYDAEDDDDYESGWYTSGDYYWNLSAEELTETYSEPSETAEITDMIVKYMDNGAKKVEEVMVAFDGNDVYLYMYGYVPGWIKGTIDGNKITVKNGQFLGYDTNYDTYEWAHTATAEQQEDEDGSLYDYGTIVDEIVFDYNADTKEMTTDGALYIDVKKNEIYYAVHFVEPTIYVYEEVAATPADPTISKFWDYEDYYGSAELDFTLNNVDVDGNYIKRDLMSYRIYVDDELFEATEDDYEGLVEPMTEFPYGFADDSGFIGRTYFCLLFQPSKNAGIQAVSRAAGEERHSNIVFYDLETGEIQTVAEDQLGINNMTSKTTKLLGTYDLQGRRVSDSAKGMVIKRMTTADGTMKNVKVVRK